MRNVVSIAAGESKVKEIRVTETGPGLLDQRSVRRPGSRKRKLVERARRQEREGLELSLATGSGENGSKGSGRNRRTNLG